MNGVDYEALAQTVLPFLFLFIFPPFQEQLVRPGGEKRGRFAVASLGIPRPRAIPSSPTPTQFNAQVMRADSLHEPLATFLFAPCLAQRFLPAIKMNLNWSLCRGEQVL
jgi:hypothetical protein